MGFWSWLWGLLFRGTSGQIENKSSLNEKLDDRTDSLQGGAGQMAGTAKTFYARLQVNTKITRKDLKQMRRLKENIVMRFKDIRKINARLAAAEAKLADPGSRGKYEHEIGRRENDRKKYAAEIAGNAYEYNRLYEDFLLRTHATLLDQKKMIGFEERFLEELFEQFRNEVGRRRIPLSPQLVPYLRNTINTILSLEISKARQEASEDNRYYHNQKVKVGFFEMWRGEDYFVKKTARDLKVWKKGASQDLNLDREIFGLLASGKKESIDRAAYLIQKHLSLLRKSSLRLGAMAHDEQEALESARNLSNQVVLEVRNAAQSQISLSQDLVKSLEENHSQAFRILENDLLDSKRLVSSLSIMQANLNRTLDQIDSYSRISSRLASVSGIAGGLKAA